MSKWEEFCRRFERMGLYGSEHRQLWSVRMEGAFEGWTGRATEDMEHRYFLEVYEFAEFGIWPFRINAKSLEELGAKALEELDRRKQFRREWQEKYGDKSK